MRILLPQPLGACSPIQTLVVYLRWVELYSGLNSFGNYGGRTLNAARARREVGRYSRENWP